MGKKVYVAGPITLGDQFSNTRHAVAAADQLLYEGYYPFVPHLTTFWHLCFPHEYEDWMEYDDAWLRECDALLRIPGESSGADREVALARELGIPVYFSVAELLAAEGAAE